LSDNDNGKVHNSFSDRLTYIWFRRQALLGRKIDQTEIAEAVAKQMGRETFVQGTVSRWLNGTEPSLDTIRAIAKVFGVDPGWLAFGEGEEPDDPAAPEFMPPRSRGPGG
jgi:transcriptional regulator with XRE-family HTH domain